MVTVAEAQVQVSEAREELEQARTQGELRRAEIKLAKVESQRVLRRQVGIGTVTSQALIRQQVGRGGVRQEITRRRRRARRQFGEAGSAISGAERELTTFQAQFPGREAEIVAVESQIKSVQQQQAEQQRQINLTNQARKLITEGKTLAARGDPALQKRIRELRAVGFETPVSQFEQFSLTQQVLPPIFQTLAPPPISPFQPAVPPRQLGGIILKREELEQLTQQSFPLGTTGRIPAEQVRTFGPREFFTTEIIPLAAVRRGVFGAGVRISAAAPTIGRIAGVPGLADIISPRREERIRLKQLSITTAVSGLGLGVRGVSTIIPTTPLSVGITAGLVAVTIAAPPAAVGVVSAGVAGFGISGALDPELTTEERVGSGIVGGLGVAGVAVGLTPFVRGIGARGTRIAPEGFEIIPGIRGVGDIGLVPPGSPRAFVNLPRTSPLRRGGFGLRQGEVSQFLGSGQILTTSQRGLFAPGVDIPIQRPFFVTPQDPTLGIGVTRVSRLGLVDPFTPPTSIQIGFGIPPPAQIGVTIGRVARAETRGAFAIGRGSELEAIRTTGIITGVRGLGRVRIRGQGVDIFAFETTPFTGSRGLGLPSARQFRTTLGTTRISGESLFASFGVRPTRGITSTVRSRGLISSRVFGGTRRPPTTDLFGTGRVTSPTIISPPPTTGLSGISGLSSTTFGLGEFGLSFPDFEPTPRPRRRRAGERRPSRRRRSRSPGIQAQLAPSFTAIAADLRGVFPTELRSGGISPRQIRVLPRRRRRRS